MIPKKYLLILLLIATIGLLTPVSAMTMDQGTSYHSGQKHSHNKDKESLCYKSYDKPCKDYGYSEISFSIKGKQDYKNYNEYKKVFQEIKNINQVKVQLNGKTIKNFKKFKYVSWELANAMDFSVKLKGNVKDKTLVVTAYDKNNKKLKTKSWKIKPSTGYSYMKGSNINT